MGSVIMELCSGDNCLDNDTLIVLCYAVFCVCFGFIVALLVMWADKSRGGNKSRSNSVSNSNNNVEVGSEHLSVDDKLEEVERSVTRLEDVHRSVTQFTTDRSTSVLDNMNQK